jgi:hypothetical protein
VTIRGQRQYLWRSVDQDGDVIDILLPAPPGPPRGRPGSFDACSSGPSCRRLCMTPPATPTTGSKSPTSLRGDASATCDASDRLRRHSASLPSTRSYGTCSPLDDISCVPPSSGWCVRVRSTPGTPSSQADVASATRPSYAALRLNLTVPSPTDPPAVARFQRFQQLGESAFARELTPSRSTPQVLDSSGTGGEPKVTLDASRR